jgi:hypothetical protein
LRAIGTARGKNGAAGDDEFSIALNGEIDGGVLSTAGIDFGRENRPACQVELQEHDLVVIRWAGGDDTVVGEHRQRLQAEGWIIGDHPMVAP